MMGGCMIQYSMLIIPGCFLLTALVFVVLGYYMGRKTITDAPLIQKSFDPKSGATEPEETEIMRCLRPEE